MAGDPDNPHVFYMARTGVATDWDFAAPITDEGGAFFTGGENEGLLRGPITAGFSLTSDSAILSTVEGLVLLYRHPRRGGGFEDMADGVYILGQGAWCKSSDDTAFFMTPLGLMTLPPNPGARPSLLSDAKIPNELKGLAYDYEDPVISMAYDSRFNGIHITVRGPEQQAWFYHLSTGGFHKQTYAGYPFVIMEHSPFITANKSGVLFGGSAYGGLSQPDRLGSEEFSAQLTVGPVPISPSVLSSSMVTRMVVSFGAGGPTSAEGVLKLATGADGEDAISRLELGAENTSVSLSGLARNNGAFHPRASGHAAAFEFSTTSGRVVLEEATLALDPRGTLRMGRISNEAWYEQVGTCQGYAEATPLNAPSEAISDGIEQLSLHLLPEVWWDLTNATGGNIRVTDSDNNFLPFDLIGFDPTPWTENVGETDETERFGSGLLVIRRPLSALPSPVRVWCCADNLAKFPLGHAFGGFNAYPPWFLSYYPGGFGPSRTGVGPEMFDGDGNPVSEILTNPFHPDYVSGPSSSGPADEGECGTAEQEAEEFNTPFVIGCTALRPSGDFSEILMGTDDSHCGGGDSGTALGDFPESYALGSVGGIIPNSDAARPFELPPGVPHNYFAVFSLGMQSVYFDGQLFSTDVMPVLHNQDSLYLGQTPPAIADFDPSDGLGTELYAGSVGVFFLLRTSFDIAVFQLTGALTGDDVYWGPFVFHSG
jgi:hypothetical protein